MRVLIIEDDRMISENIREALRREAFAVDCAGDGREAELALSNGVYDLVLLDLSLPKRDGLTVLRDFRVSGNNTPVIIMTARDAVADRIAGLDAGADDYLVKPFDLGELSARMRALLRRRTGQPRPVYVHGALQLDDVSREVTVDGVQVNLVPREYALFRALIDEPTRVFSKKELEEKLYGWNEEVESNTIEVHVHNLRKKLGAERIVTIRGVGYRMATLS
jgi:two-component system, OmpR family, response regulator QseB